MPTQVFTFISLFALSLGLILGGFSQSDHESRLRNLESTVALTEAAAAAIDESKEDLDALIKNKEATIERIKTMQLDLETQSCNTPGE